MATPCKSSLPEDSDPFVTGIGRSAEDREIRMTTPVSSATLALGLLPANTARRNTCAEKMPTKLMMSSSIASGQKTKAPVTKMGLTYWFLR